MTTPRPPGRPARSTLSQATGALTPVAGRKFHCTFCQPPGVAPRPGSSGRKLARAIRFGAAVATPGRRRSSATVASTDAPSRIRSTRVRGANARGAPTPVARWVAARSARSAPAA